MSTKLLVGITGHMGSGKTTVAKYLINQQNFVEKSFADPLKAACKALFLFSDEQVFGTQEQKATPDPRWFGCSPRTALQFVGTELLRNNLDQIMPGLGQAVFVHHFKLWFESQSDNVVLHDVRFLNEAKALKDLGGIVIRIRRSSSDCIQHTHQSEIEIDQIEADYYVDNESGLDELFDRINQILDENRLCDKIDNLSIK